MESAPVDGKPADSTRPAADKGTPAQGKAAKPKSKGKGKPNSPNTPQQTQSMNEAITKAKRVNAAYNNAIIAAQTIADAVEKGGPNSYGECQKYKWHAVMMSKLDALKTRVTKEQVWQDVISTADIATLRRSTVLEAAAFETAIRRFSVDVEIMIEELNKEIGKLKRHLTAEVEPEAGPLKRKRK